jgi:hypothetical protein
MTLASPRLDLTPGKIICLHLPHGFSGDYQPLENALLQIARRENKSAIVSRPAIHHGGILESLWPQKSHQWLAKAAGISLEESKTMIAEFGVPVAENLSWNAANPRCLLGIAAVIVRRPDVLIYRTDGLDPRGMIAAHRYAASHGGALCLVHLSSPIVFGNGPPAPRHCPPHANCVVLSENL